MLHARKSVGRLGLLQPKTVLAMMAIKQYIADNRVNNNIVKTIKIAEDKIHVISRYSKKLIEVNQKDRYCDEGQIDYIAKILEDRELKVLNRVMKINK